MALSPSLDPAVLTALNDLELVARATVDGTLSGLHSSPFHGYSAEFSQYRHYRQGDDLKYIDWKLFARTDRLYTKQFRETTNATVQIVLDASRSMAFAGANGVSKIAYGRLVAAALAHLTAGQGDAVGLVVHDDAIRQYLPGRTGQTHLRAVLTALTRTDSARGTAAAASLRRAVDLMPRRGLLIAISDFYDDGEAVESELRRAVHIGHDLAMFQVLTREELDFPYDRDVELEDLETGRTVLTGAAARGHYRREFADFLERWHERCAKYRIDYTRILTDQPLDIALRGYLIRRAGGHPS
ncbi:MAG TPA: DUF58 domain-containing protein [Vicinamibacterales bacterium]|nr:DUF58 domain-containing protein [Vicinamibacterales bacterium]